MQAAFQKDQQLLDDIARAKETGATRVWWLGQSGFLVHTPGATILFDPYLSDSLTKKYAATDKPHVRLTEQVIAPEKLTGIDLITSSHNHSDHLDAETLLPLFDANPQAKLVIPRANRGFVIDRLGAVELRLIELDAGEEQRVGAVAVHGIPAAHNTVERDAQGRCKYLGFVVRTGDLTLYHSGDTMMHDGLVPALRPFRIDLGFLPINGFKPERRVAGNLDGREAAALAHGLAIGLVVPHHYDMFAFNTVSPDLFESECRRLGQPFRVLRNGEGASLGAPGSAPGSAGTPGSAGVLAGPGSADVPVGMVANTKNLALTPKRDASASGCSEAAEGGAGRFGVSGRVNGDVDHPRADEDVGAPGGVGMVANTEIPILTPKRDASTSGRASGRVNEDVDHPGADEDGDVGAPRCAPKEWFSRGFLLHRDRSRLLQAITFRLADSLPQKYLTRLERELELAPEQQRDAHKRKRIEQWLDAGLGCCALRHQEAAAFVQDALLHFDGQRYRMLAWVIMPNHVHVLIDPILKVPKIVQGWKSFTARWLLDQNESLGLGIPDTDRVWMREYWDRYMRDSDHMRHTINYIHQNPVKAGLCKDPSDWPWSSAASGAPGSAGVLAGPGSADVPVGMVANTKNLALTPKRDASASGCSEAAEGGGGCCGASGRANEDVDHPGADEDVGAPRGFAVPGDSTQTQLKP